MLLTVLSIQLVVRALCEAAPAPPRLVHVKGGLVTWSPAPEPTDVRYTVQHQGFGDQSWENVSYCVHTSLTSCNITSIKAHSEGGCVRLRVQAERRGLSSRPVEACSRHGDTCTPEVNLTARPGFLTAYLSINTSMEEQYGGHIQNRVYYGKEGESLERNYEYGASSVSIYGLEEGSRYCVKVQHLLHGEVFGTDSCIQCVAIPESEKELKLTEVIVVLVVVLALAFLIPAIGYILIFHQEKIKQWLQPPYSIPDHYFLTPTTSHQLRSPSEDE